MISTTTFQFLKDLKNHNNKTWFDDNRAVYQSLRREFEVFVDQLIHEIGLFDKEAAQTTAKASIFRINRDIRFSNVKLPYKTNFGAYIAKGGRKSISAGYYIHVEPGECFIGGGIYMPSGPVLKALRSEIYDNMDEFKSILQAPAFVKHFRSELWGEKLKTAPKGFPIGYKDMEYLKYKHYTVIKNEPDQAYTQPGFIHEVVDVFRSMSAFNAFLNRAVEDVETS